MHSAALRANQKDKVRDSCQGEACCSVVLVGGNFKRLSERFLRFSEEAREHDGPLYEHLAAHIADDPELLTVANEVLRPPVPNTLFAAVHFLLLRNPESNLGRYYGSIAGDPVAPESAYPTFREFVLEHRTALSPILKTRWTQTNEVRRCSFLLPAFNHVYESSERMPLSLIDVGCSAGLHLLWDRYYYDYGKFQCGDSEATVHVDCEIRGPTMPPIPSGFPSCVFRLGIDLNPIDLQCSEERLWLEALVWPEHAARRKLLAAAVAVALEHPPPMRSGDAIDVLPGAIGEVPDDTVLLIYHSAALCQIGKDQWGDFRRMLLQCSKTRPIYWLKAEGQALEISYCLDGMSSDTTLGERDGHGRWLQWAAS